MPNDHSRASGDPSITLPESPVERLLELSEAIARRKRWFQGWSSLRFAAVGLLVLPDEADALVERLFDTAHDLYGLLSPFSTLRTDLRFCLASMLMRQGRTAGEYVDALASVRRGFREQRLGRSEVHEGLACAVLLDAADGDLPHASRVEALAAVYHGMREHHPWVTGRDDYAAAALLSASGERVDVIVERIEALYQALRGLRFTRGNQLQLASHLLYFAPGPDAELAARFRAIYDAFKADGRWMHEGDYDEMALLASFELPTDEVVGRVSADRRRLRAELRPRPGPQAVFDLACATAVVGLIGSHADDQGRFSGLALAQLIGIVQAQQAAMVAASAGAAGAAAASG